MPRPDGSSGPRRASSMPASAKDPEHNHLPHAVVPSSFNLPNQCNFCPVFIQPRKAGQLLSGFDYLVRLFVLEVRKRLPIDLFGHFGERWMLRVGIGPRSMQDRIGELATLLLIKIANPQVNLRDDVLIDP